MSERKIVVPEGMLSATAACHPYSTPRKERELIIGMALHWLMENPIVPTVEQYLEMIRSDDLLAYQAAFCKTLPIWQRRMFLAPEPEVPEEVKDMLPDSDDACRMTVFDYKRRILEAFRRGQKAGSKLPTISG